MQLRACLQTLILIGAAAPTAAGQSTLHVAPCGSNAWTGASPICAAPDGPKATIQAAMNAAADGDDILVASGSYAGNVNFNGKAVWLHSVDGERATTIVGTVNCMSGEGPQTIFEGFTVTHNGLVGRGMQVHDSDPIVRHVTFLKNRVFNSTFGGGGMAAIGPKTPTVEFCTFIANDSEGQPSSPTCRSNGGGLSLRGGFMRLVNCVFLVNRAFGVCEEGPQPYGGGIHVEPFTGATLEVIHCSFAGNVSPGLGAFSNAIYAGGQVVIRNSALGVAQTVHDSVLGNVCFGMGLFRDDPGPGPDLSWGTPDDEYGDLRLGDGSPCIDGGNNADVPVDLVVDMDGNPRFVDDCGSSDTGMPGGAGGAAIVDLGAYELQGSTGIRPYCTTTPNSAGAGARIACGGSTSVAANEFVLTAGPVLPGRAGLFVHGGDQTSVPLGGATLCVGGAIVRAWPEVIADAFGTLTLSLDYASAGGLGIEPGVTRFFQAWYRDDAPSGFNLSDGLAVTFRP